MRIGIAGKGGVGKTTVAATTARLASRAGDRVIAIDADSNPNLAAALGLNHTAQPLPVSLVSKRLDGPALTDAVDSVLTGHGIAGPDGVVMLTMGGPAHAGEGCLCSAHATVGAVLADLGQDSGPEAGPRTGQDGGPELVTVVDMEASPEQLSRGTVRNVDVLLLVAEPYFRSLETVRRLAPLAVELSIARIGVVANKLRSAADGDAVAEFCQRHELSLLGNVPYDDAVAAADLDGRPLLDAAPDSPAVAAIGELTTRLRTAGVPQG